MSKILSKHGCTFCDTIYPNFIKGKAITGIKFPTANPSFIARDEHLYYLYVYKNNDVYKHRMITKCPVCRRKLGGE